MKAAVKGNHHHTAEEGVISHGGSAGHGVATHGVGEVAERVHERVLGPQGASPVRAPDHAHQLVKKYDLLGPLGDHGGFLARRGASAAGGCVATTGVSRGGTEAGRGTRASRERVRGGAAGREGAIVVKDGIFLRRRSAASRVGDARRSVAEVGAGRARGG